MKRLALIFATSLILVAVTSAQNTKVRVDISPKAGFRPLKVRAGIFVANPDEKFWCPAALWDWGDDSGVSMEERSCKPFGETKPEERKRIDFWPRTHAYVIPGEYILTMRLLKNGKVIWTQGTHVMVLGPEGGLNK